MKPTFYIPSLDEPSRYLALIDRLFEKYKKRGRLTKEDSLGAHVLLLAQENVHVARLLSQALSSGEYTFAPPVTRLLQIGKKKRTISTYHLMDTLAQSALFGWLLESATEILSPYVYSYVPSRSAEQAIAAFIRYMDQKRAANGHIDLFVFRMDLAAYTDTIPVGAHSVLWDWLDKLLEKKALGTQELAYMKALLETILRPIYQTKEGALYQHCVGVPTGSSLTTIAGLMYVSELDKCLGDIEGGFYARYGDDILFAHDSFECFQVGYAMIEKIVTRLKLKRNMSKEQCIYFTCSGRAHETYTSLKGNHIIGYLGYAIYANGTLSLPVAKYQLWIHQLRERLKQVNQMMQDKPFHERGRSLCLALNRMLHPNHPFCEKMGVRLLQKVNNRGVLKELDYALALMVAQLMSGREGVKAWRVVSYKKIRAEWQLRSLCHHKNKQTKVIVWGK